MKKTFFAFAAIIIAAINLTSFRGKSIAARQFDKAHYGASDFSNLKTENTPFQMAFPKVTETDGDEKVEAIVKNIVAVIRDK